MTPASEIVQSTPAVHAGGPLTVRLQTLVDPPANSPKYVLKANLMLPRIESEDTELDDYSTPIDLFIFSKSKNVERYPCVSLRVAEELLLRMCDSGLKAELILNNQALARWVENVMSRPWNRVQTYLRMFKQYQPVFFAPTQVTEGLMNKVTSRPFPDRLTFESIDELYDEVDLLQVLKLAEAITKNEFAR